MARTQQEIGGLIAKIFDRLETQFEGNVVIEDAMILVEVSDPNDMVRLDDGTGELREAPATLVLLESTTDRVTVQIGIIGLAERTISEPDYLDESDE